MKHTVHTIKLPNGAEGLLIDVPTAQVMTYEVNFRAGEYLVDEQVWEAPHIMEHMLLGANEEYRTQRGFQAEFEKNGAYSNASTSVYHVNYDAECADFEWDRIAKLLVLAISKPLFSKQEFHAEVGNVREELHARSNNHLRHLSLAMRSNYGFVAKTDQERLALIDNVNLDEVVAHYKRTHVTTNMRFVIAGKLPAKRREWLSAQFAGIQLPVGVERFELPIEQPKFVNVPMYIHNETVENMYFYVDMFLERRLTDQEADALQLFNTILTETLYSRVLGAAREQGLVYHMGSGTSRLKSASTWWFGAQVMPNNAGALFDIMISELTRIKNGTLDKKDLEIAKSYSIGRYLRSGQTVGGTADGYSGRYFFDDLVDDYYKIPERIQAVTKEAIVQVAREFFEKPSYGLGVLGSCGPEHGPELAERMTPIWG